MRVTHQLVGLSTVEFLGAAREGGVERGRRLTHDQLVLMPAHVAQFRLHRLGAARRSLAAQAQVGPYQFITIQNNSQPSTTVYNNAFLLFNTNYY